MKAILGQLIKSEFPAQHIVYALGYGSAVFKQANYDQSNSEQVIDMIFVVDDTLKFHEQNMKMNQKHYSYFAKRLPPRVTDGLVQNSGSNLYFNPLIPLKSFSSIREANEMRRIKYGVIGVDKAFEDLSKWTNFALAGRLQKPILPLIDSSSQQFNEIEQAILTNRKMAALLAVFLHFQKEMVTIEELMMTLVSFSYKGDMRMRFKMENPMKVQNLVQGSLQQLSELYVPILLEFQESGIVEFRNDGSLKFVRNNANVQLMLDQFPESIKQGLKRQAIQLALFELQEDLQNNLQQIVNNTSKQMFLSGLYSTNPIKGIPYLLSKFAKARKNNKK